MASILSAAAAQAGCCSKVAAMNRQAVVHCLLASHQLILTLRYIQTRLHDHSAFSGLPASLHINPCSSTCMVSYQSLDHLQVIEHMTQEIGSAVEHDKKTAKKQAATRAIDFLLKYTPSTPLVPVPVAPPEGPATSSALGNFTHKLLHLVRGTYPPLAWWADGENSTPKLVHLVRGTYPVLVW